MDLDGDGHRDVITGSWPGALYLFKGGADNTFAEAVRLQDKNGAEVMVGQASVVFATDWDKDQDLDLVVGCIDGFVWLVPNESGSKELKFGEAVKLESADGPIRQHHSAPVVADWDGNGTLDLIVGQGDGNVVMYANSSRAGAPKLAASEIIFKSSGKMDGSACGVRVKPCVTDWNGDGHLDLLVGDFSMGKPKEISLTDEQKATLEKLKGEEKGLMAKLHPLQVEAAKRLFGEMGFEVDEEADMQKVFEGMSEDHRREYIEKVQKVNREHEGIQKLQQQMQEVSEQMQALQPPSPVQGNVWVMLRKVPAVDRKRPG